MHLQINQTNPPKIAGSIISKAIQSKIARNYFKEAKDTYDQAKLQEKIREKRKEYTRLMTTKTIQQAQKEIAQKKFNKTEHVFERKSNAGRPPTNPYQD